MFIPSAPDNMFSPAEEPLPIASVDGFASDLINSVCNFLNPGATHARD